MIQLNLPEVQLKTRIEAGKPMVFDPTRSKWVAFTPEEYVRQSFVSYLVTSLDYPMTHIQNESGIRQGGMERRCDTLIYDLSGCVKVIVEYKSPSVKLTQKVFDQITRYNLSLKVDYLMITNGLTHYCVKMDYEANSYTFLTQLPTYTSL